MNVYGGKGYVLGYVKNNQLNKPINLKVSTLSQKKS
jgi:hypothetical protein